MKKTLFSAMFLMAAVMMTQSAGAQTYSLDTTIDDVMPGDKQHHDELYYLVCAQSADESPRSIYRSYMAAVKAMNEGDMATAMSHYEQMYDVWSEVFFQAPLCGAPSNPSGYIPDGYKMMYIAPTTMFSYLIKNESDEEQRLKYFADFMTLLRTRIRNVDNINAMQTRDDRKSTLGELKSLYAFWYFAAGMDVYANTKKKLNYKTAYNNFHEAIEEVRRGGAKSIEPYILQPYIGLSAALFQQDNSFRENFLQDYLDCVEVCEMMLETVNEVDEFGDRVLDGKKVKSIVEGYSPILQMCDSFLMYSGAADSTQIVNYFGPKVEEKKNDINFLRKVLTLMAENGCDNTDIYYQASEYAYQIEPTYESAIAMAKKAAERGDEVESMNKYTQALDLAKSDKQKAKVAMFIANSMANSKNYNKAYVYLDKAADYDVTQRGKAKFKKAQYLAKQEKYTEALAACEEAAAADVTYAEAGERLSRQIQQNIKNLEEYNKAMAEYRKRKQAEQEEADFWNKGRK